jgi:hypothetical protein
MNILIKRIGDMGILDISCFAPTYYVGYIDYDLEAKVWHPRSDDSGILYQTLPDAKIELRRLVKIIVHEKLNREKSRIT